MQRSIGCPTGAPWPGVLVLTLTLAGCIGGPPGTGAGTSTGSGPTGPATSPDSAPDRAPTAPASDALLRVAREAQASGDYAAAGAALERAIRIAPTEASLWLALGELRLATGDAAQARAMALKALSLADASTTVAADAQRLLDATAAR